MRQNRKLREIAIIAAGQGAPQGEDNYCVDGTPFIKAGNLIELINGKAETEVQKVNEQVARNHKLKKYPQGTVLFAKSGMSCMKGYVYQLKNPCYVVSHLACIIPKAIKGEYLKYYFEFHKPNSLVKDEAYPSISLLDIGELSISYGSEAEQEEIVRNLDKINRIINKRRLEIQKIDDLVKSQFIEMFGGGKFEELPISEFVDIQIESAKKKYNAEDSIRYIDISSIDNKLNLMTGFSEYYFKDAPSRAQQCLKCGDIVISTVRPNLRNIAMNNYQYSNLVASSGFCILRAKKCNSKFLFCAVLLDDFSRKMTEVTTGANYPAIKDSDVLSYRIPNAPIDAQNKFAQFVQQTDKSKVLNLIHFFSINPYRRVVKSGKICYNKAHKEVV